MKRILFTIFIVLLFLLPISVLAGSGTDVDVDDGSWFYGDEEITIGTDQVTLTGVTTNNLQWTGSITWADNDDVWFRHFAGVATDIGANEYEEGPQNQPPVISASSVTPTTVANEGTLTYSVTASDPESQTLTYSWRINGTEFSTSASSTYVLPATYNNQTVQIYCQVCDPGPLCINSSTFNIQVGTVAKTTVSFGENTADTHVSTFSDTHIVAGNADTNYSTYTQFTVKDDTTATIDKFGVLAVDISTLTAETTSDAYLRVELNYISGLANASTITLWDCDDVFTAVGATYNCAVDDPVNGCTTAWTTGSGGSHGRNTALATITVDSNASVGTWYTFEGAALDTYVEAQKAGICYFILSASPEQIGVLNFTSSDGDNGNRPSLYVTYSDVPPSGNDFTNEASCIGWWELNDNTDSKGSDNLTSSNGNPTYDGGGGLILDGDDAIYLANLTGNITADMTVWAKYKFSAELTDMHMLTDEWDSTGNQKCWHLMMRESLAGGDTEDHVQFAIGSNSGEDSNATEDTSFDLVHGTTYNTIGTFDNTNKDMHIYTFNEGGTSLENTDPNATHNVAINNENVSFYIGRQEDAVGASHYCPATTTVYEVGLFTRELTEDEAQALASEQFPVASIQDVWAQTPDTTGTIGIGDTFVIGIEFDKSVTWTDAALPYGYVEVETGGTDLALYHSSPATTVAATIHYFSTHATDANYVNSMIVAGMASADANLKAGSITLNGGTFQYGSPAIDADVSLPTDSLSGNAAIVIDTTAPVVQANGFFHCDSDKAQIAAETTYNAGDTCYLCVESDGDALFFNEGPLGNLQIGTDMSYPINEEFEYYTGIGTAILQFYRVIQAGDRDLDLQAEGVAEDVGLIHGATKLQDAAGNEMTYALDAADPAGGNIIISAPSTETASITVGSGGDIAKISDMSHQLNSDVYQYLEPITDDVDITADSVLITGIGRSQANTGTLTFTGDNNHVRCVRFNSGDLNMGLGPDTVFPGGVETLNQNEYGSGWEIGAYVYE